MRRFVLVLILLLTTAVAESSNREIVHQGRVLRPDGTPLEGSFIVEAKIYSPDSTKCLMWGESKPVVFSRGVFNYSLGDVTKRLSGAAAGQSLTFQSVFVNDPSFALTGAVCETGSTYTPTSSDDRRLVITLYDGPMVVNVYDDKIKSVPFAIEASNATTVGGYGSSRIFKFTTTADRATATFSTVGANILWDLGEAATVDLGGKTITGLDEPTVPTGAATLKTVTDAVAAATFGSISAVTRVDAISNSPSILSILGGPVTSVGTFSLSFENQNPGTVFAAPTGAAGTPLFRALSAADISTGTLGVNRGGTGLTAFTPYAIMASNMTGDAIEQRVCADGEVLEWQTTIGFVCVDRVSGVGTVTAVTAGTGLLGGVINSTGTLSVDVGLTEGQIVAVGTGDKIPLALIPTIPLADTSGTLGAARGGTGLDTSSAANGQLLIGNGSGFALNTLTAGSGITITNAAGSIAISASAGSGSVTAVGFEASPLFAVTGTTITSTGTFQLSLASQSAGLVLASPTGAAGVPSFRALSTNDLASGTLGVDRGGTGLVPTAGNANQVYGLDATGLVSEFKSIVAGTGVSVLHSAGSIEISLSAGTAGQSQWSNVARGIHYSSGSVGVGTNTPAAALHIASSGSTLGSLNPSNVAIFQGDGTGGTDAGIRIASGSTGAAYLDFGNTYVDSAASIAYGNSDQKLYLNVGGTSRVVINNQGQVGIGTSSPTAALDIVATGTLASSIRIPRDSTAMRPVGSSAADLVGMLRYNTTLDKYEVYESAAGWVSLTSGSIANSQWTDIPKGLNFASGSVGIGTADPGSMLDVQSSSSTTIQAVAATSTITGSAVFLGSRARGNLGAQTYPLSGDYLASFAGGNNLTQLDPTSMAVVASENHSATNWGSEIVFNTVPSGGTIAAPRVKFGHDGRVGIGTLSPTVALDIVATGTLGSAIRIPRAGSGARPVGSGASDLVGMLRYNTDLDKYEVYEGTTGWASLATGSLSVSNLWAQGGNAFGQTGTLGTNDNSALAITTFGTTRISVLPSGNVGIGVTNPSTILSISGSDNGSGSNLTLLNASTGPLAHTHFQASNSGSMRTYVGITSTGWTPTWLQPSEGYLYSSGNNGLHIASLTVNRPIKFSTGDSSTPTERMRITHNGLVGLGTTSPTAALDITATGTLASAIRIPRDSTAMRPVGSSASDLVGMMRYNTTDDKYEVYEGTTGWASLATGSLASSQWTSVARGVNYASGSVGIGVATPTQMLDVAGNINIPAGNSYFYDGVRILGYAGGTENFAVGPLAMGSATVTGSYNTAVGQQALEFLTSGDYNTAVGGEALKNNTTGGHNTAVGSEAAENNTTGSYNTAMGELAFHRNTSGQRSVAIGFAALYNVTTNARNTAVGSDAGYSLVTGDYNTMVGEAALGGGTTAYNTTAIGYNAGAGANGNDNIFIGGSAGTTAFTGNKNILIGNNVEMPFAAVDNQLAIGNAVYGTALTGTGTTVSANARIGIGVRSPTAGLDIDTKGTIGSAIRIPRDTTAMRPVGSAASDLIGMMRYNTTDGKYEVYESTGGWLSISTGTTGSSLWTAATNGITYNSGGSVGIGTVNPVAKLNVVGHTQLETGLSVYDNNSNLYAPTGGSAFPATGMTLLSNPSATGGAASAAMLATRNPTGYSYGYVAAVSSATGYTPSMVFGLTTDEFAYTERMRIDASGRLGIGTTAPSYKLDVNGPVASKEANPMFVTFDTSNTKASDNFTGGLYIKDSANSNAGYMGFESGDSSVDMYLGANTGTSGGVRFQSNGTTNAYLSGSGLFGIGTLTPTAALDVVAVGTLGSAIRIPRDTSAMRPVGSAATDLQGMMRYNTSIDKYEVYEGLTGWTNLATGSIATSQWTDQTLGISYDTGSVAIGRTAPRDRLDVEGFARVERLGLNKAPDASTEIMFNGTTAGDPHDMNLMKFWDDGTNIFGIGSTAWTINFRSENYMFYVGAQTPQKGIYIDPGSMTIQNYLHFGHDADYNGYFHASSGGGRSNMEWVGNAGAAGFKVASASQDILWVGNQGHTTNLELFGPGGTMGVSLNTHDPSYIRYGMLTVGETWGDGVLNAFHDPSVTGDRATIVGVQPGLADGFTTGIVLGRDDDTAGEAALFSYTHATTAADRRVGIGHNRINEVISILQNGSVGIGTTAPAEKLDVNGNVQAVAYFYSSDRRLKTDIEPVSGLSTILKLNGKTFTWRANQRRDVGLIAQEVEEVFPQLVSTNPKTGLKAVQYGNLVAPLIEATKELYGLCQASESQWQALGQQVAGHERRMIASESEIERLKSENAEQRKEIDALKAYLCAKDPSAPICK